MSKEVKVGQLTLGGGAPVAVQSMLNVHHSDIAGNVAQAKLLQDAGCEIIRAAIPNSSAVALIPALKAAVDMPVVADIHFDYRLAIESVAAGADKIRINPGNIGGDDRVRLVVDACRERNVPIRVGVNSGSVEKELLAQYGGPTAQAMAQSARHHVAMIEQYDYDNIVVSIKSSDVPTMIAAYRLAAEWCDYPFHLGVTETGTRQIGMIKSAIGIGSLLCDGIGDTIRVSLTGEPADEVAVAWDILKAAGVRRRGIDIISCPTCGRTEIDLQAIVEEVERQTSDIETPLKVAIMGCVVNGPGEAVEADIGIAGGKDSAVLFMKGKVVRKITGDIAAQLVQEIRRMQENNE